MTGTVTITFSQTGVEPPVYVVTSASSPPWETLEMRMSDEQTASANLIFTKQIERVAEGSYQYKIRIGDGNWVLDESKETAPDEHGNRNNVAHVQPTKEVESPASAPAAKASKRKDSSVDSNQLSQQPSIPVPFVVVEGVADQEQPEYGDVEPKSLPVDEAKRTADAEPDVEAVRPDESGDVHRAQTPEIPLLVVEKTDDKPAYGEDFGKDATISQRVAHDMRAADAAPDELIISPESQSTSSNDDEVAPLLLHHKVFPMHESASSLDAVNEDSAQSSTGRTSSTDIIHTQSEQDVSQEVDDSDPGSENGAINGNGVPLLPHETRLEDEGGASSGDDDNEFDRAPLLPHETGFSGYNEHVIITNGDHDHGVVTERQHYDHYDSHDSEDEADANGDYDETPLLPHERDSAVASNAGSELSADDAHYILYGQSSFSHETDNAKELFEGNRRPNFFRTRSNSSTLPHELPRSDAEDENLNDPLLERFPTSRDQILERVATIGLHLPEDHPVGDSLHSPQLFINSQACSSVDLVPVKSYVSLASVPEADDSDDDDDDDDRDSLPSPMLIGARHSSSHHTRDQHPPAVPEECEPFDLPAAKLQAPSAHSAESRDAENISQTDGSKDNSSTESLREVPSTPAKILNSLASESPAVTSSEHAPLRAESQLRQRHSSRDDSAKTTQASPTMSSEDKASQPVSPSLRQQPNTQSGNFLQNLFRVLFGSIGRFLAACLGDRKRASTTAMVVGLATAGYYLWTWVS